METERERDREAEMQKDKKRKAEMEIWIVRYRGKREGQKGSDRVRFLRQAARTFQGTPS